MVEPSCIKLAERFGGRYRIDHEEQAAEWPVAERQWLARIRCHYGHVGVQGGDRLSAFTDHRVIGARLRRLPFVERAQGDVEVRIVFHVAHLAAVLAILKPYRRRQGLSEAQHAALVAGRRKFARRHDVENSAETAPESTQADADSPEGRGGMNAKAKGTRNEHRSRLLLEAAGYTVTRAAASLGVLDLVGIGSTDVVLVQVKSNEWPRSAEMEALSSFRVPPNCRRLVHRWRDRQRVPDVREV